MEWLPPIVAPVHRSVGPRPGRPVLLAGYPAAWGSLPSPAPLTWQWASLSSSGILAPFSPHCRTFTSFPSSLSNQVAQWRQTGGQKQVPFPLRHGPGSNPCSAMELAVRMGVAFSHPEAQDQARYTAKSTNRDESSPGFSKAKHTLLKGLKMSQTRVLGGWEGTTNASPLNPVWDRLYTEPVIWRVPSSR